MSWRTLGRTLGSWVRSQNLGNPLKKGEMETVCNYRPVSLTWLLRKKVHQIIKQSIYKHLRDDKVIKISQCRFVKNKLCQPNLISFLTGLMTLWIKGRQQMWFILILGVCYYPTADPHKQTREMWPKKGHHKVYAKTIKKKKSDNSMSSWEDVSKGILSWVWHYSVFSLLTWMISWPCSGGGVRTSNSRVKNSKQTWQIVELGQNQPNKIQCWQMGAVFQ